MDCFLGQDARWRGAATGRVLARPADEPGRAEGGHGFLLQEQRVPWAADEWAPSVGLRDNARGGSCVVDVDRRNGTALAFSNALLAGIRAAPEMKMGGGAAGYGHVATARAVQGGEQVATTAGPVKRTRCAWNGPAC